MEKQRIIVSNADDRQTLAVILIKNGYTVRFVKEKPADKKQIAVHVEYWRDVQ